jgi:hypothetical protein
MHKSIIKTAANGIPLQRTDLPSVEQFLVDKVTADLGDFKKNVKIVPVLRVDEEDGDMSGNLKNGFGNVMINVAGVNLHLPFIVHEKHLIPFDVIRLGEQEVMYDASKLQKIVNGILNRQKESAGSGSEGFSFGEVVDGKDINSNNGFLGTIMSIRDDEASRGNGGSGILPFSGPEFGVVADERLDRYASTDLVDVFHACMEKLASLKIMSEREVEQYADGIAKVAAEESAKQIQEYKSVNPTPGSLEDARLKRHVSQLDKEKLASVKRAASGNNIEFPLSENGMMEYRSGRVYHNIEPLVRSERRAKLTQIDSVIIDNRHHYRILRNGQEFMMSTRDAKHTHIPVERARGLSRDKMYAFELGDDKISHPFVVECVMTVSYGPDTPRSFRFAKNIKDQIKNTLFSEAYQCKEAFPSERKEDSFRTVFQKSFKIIVSDIPDTPPVYMDEKQMMDYITEHAESPEDAKAARELIGYGKDFYLLPPNFPMFKLEKKLEGHFTRPDGFFKEGPLVKQAAYKNLNIARLIVEKDSKPRKYTIEWTYGEDKTVDPTGSKAVQLQQRKQTSLSEAQAKNVLIKLGYDHRKIAVFLEVVKRNGREARFPLPDIEKAKNITPEDISKFTKGNIMSTVFNATLNAGNFLPMMEDVMAGGVNSTIDSLLSKASFSTAVSFEKLANQTNAPSWHELSALLNLKHRFDKVAEETVRGSVVLDTDGLFKAASHLKPFISKYAKQLLDLNRKQIIGHKTPNVSVPLVKEALRQLDGL